MLEPNTVIMSDATYDTLTHPVFTFLNLALSFVDSKPTKPIPVPASEEMVGFFFLC